ncbi:MAG: hypothetical protein V7724_09510 [Sediminicola sp.]
MATTLLLNIFRFRTIGKRSFRKLIFRNSPMHFYQGTILLALLMAHNLTSAQSFEGLQHLEGYGTDTYYSKGTGAKAVRMAAQLDRALAFYGRHLQFTPSVTLLILAPEDWKAHTRFPFYGMPHYTNNKTLVVASEDNAHWKSLIPTTDKIPAAYAEAVKKIYSDQNGGLTMEAFFDLLAIHELGHAYHNQGGLVMQRRWMAELFSNLLLHVFIAEEDPALLPALTTFPKLVVATTERSELTYTSLQELETNYNEIGPNHPENYGWYQCRWHMAAGEIYDQSKIQGLVNLWNCLKARKEPLNDTELVEVLHLEVHPSIANVPLHWDD